MLPSRATSSRRAKAYAPPSPSPRLPTALHNLPHWMHQPLTNQMIPVTSPPHCPLLMSSTSRTSRLPSSTPMTPEDSPSRLAVATSTSPLPSTAAATQSSVPLMSTGPKNTNWPPTTPSCAASPTVATTLISKSLTISQHQIQGHHCGQVESLIPARPSRRILLQCCRASHPNLQVPLPCHHCQSTSHRPPLPLGPAPSTN
jgi:hypothetical protein